MERLRVLITENLDTLPEFNYYLPIIDKALNYEQSRPDTAIECCNALLQGFSKTIVLNLEEGVERADLDRPSEATSNRLVKRALRCLEENDDSYELDFAKRGASLALAIATLRNARGDISHGKAVPKELQSHSNLAEATNEVSGTFLRYMYVSYLQIKQTQATEPVLDDDEDVANLAYDDNQDFNDYLDEANPLEGKLLYSDALFRLYQEDYEIQLSDYRDAQAEETDA